MYQFLQDDANIRYQALIHETQRTRLALQIRAASKPKRAHLRQLFHSVRPPTRPRTQPVPTSC